MTNRRSLEHLEVRELLARYADLLQAGLDAASLYPVVTAHLERCSVCRAVLESMLAPSEANIGDDGYTPAHDLPFLQGSDIESYMLRPLSTPSSFALRVALPLSDDLFPEQGQTYAEDLIMHSLDVPRAGERLLSHEVIPFGEGYIQIMLTLQPGPEPGQFMIAGEICNLDSLSPELEATLQLGLDIYVAKVQEGRFRFEGVTFSKEHVKYLLLTFETTDQDTTL